MIRSILRWDRYGTIHFPYSGSKKIAKRGRKEGKEEAGRLHTAVFPVSMSSSDSRVSKNLPPTGSSFFFFFLSSMSNKPRHRFILMPHDYYDTKCLLKFQYYANEKTFFFVFLLILLLLLLSIMIWINKKIFLNVLLIKFMMLMKKIY